VHSVWRVATTYLPHEDAPTLISHLYACAIFDISIPTLPSRATILRMASTMDGFDPLAMPYMHSPMPFPSGNMQNLDYMSVPSVMDLQDQYSNFDSETYIRCAWR
jgi:hypothetical protein